MMSIGSVTLRSNDTTLPGVSDSGVASLHAARAGAEVTHVDSSKKAITQAFANRDTAGMQDAPIRFITEDARSFVQREARRGQQFNLDIG